MLRPLTLLCLLPLAAAADLRLERTTTWELARPGSPAERSARREILWLGPGRLRVDDQVSKESWILREDKKVLWRIDWTRKSYSEVSFDEASASRKRIIEDLKLGVARVAGSDDEARLKQILETFSGETGDVEVKDTGSASSVAGTDVRDVSLAGKSSVLAKLKVAESVKGIDRLASLFALSGLMPKPQSDALARIKGLPLSGQWTLVFPEATVRETFDTTKWEEKDAPADTYELPTSLRKVPPPSLRLPEPSAEVPAGGYTDGQDAEGEEEPSGEEAGKDE